MLVRVQSVSDAPADYLTRQRSIATQATGIDSTPVAILYTPDEHQMWADAQALLAPTWERYAAAPVRSAAMALDLPRHEIPQLSLVTERLETLTGFRYASVPGTVSGTDFFGALANKVFPSTQFIRWSGNAEYTPEPDVLHEIGGHANVLAHPRIAELHVLAGQAAVAAPDALSEIASVFWYSVEFGVLNTTKGPKAYGAGLLSSPGELGWFAEHARIEPLDVAAMLATPYDISRYQPVLFAGDSLDHVVDVVGGYFTSLITMTHHEERSSHVSP